MTTIVTVSLAICWSTVVLHCLFHSTAAAEAPVRHNRRDR